MDISHERDFKKRRSAGRQPARETVKDTRADLKNDTQDFDLRRSRGNSAPREDSRRRRQDQSRRMYTGQADRKALDMQEAESPVHEDNPSYNNGSGILEPREPATAKPDMPFREEPAWSGRRQGSRNGR